MMLVGCAILKILFHVFPILYWLGILYFESFRGCCILLFFVLAGWIVFFLFSLFSAAVLKVFICRHGFIWFLVY